MKLKIVRGACSFGQQSHDCGCQRSRLVGAQLNGIKKVEGYINIALEEISGSDPKKAVTTNQNQSHGNAFPSRSYPHSRFASIDAKICTSVDWQCRELRLSAYSDYKRIAPEKAGLHRDYSAGTQNARIRIIG